MKISASITDFPVFSRLETFFREFKNAGVDGVELVLGIKSRFDAKKIQQLVKKYKLPIMSIHQPPWSGIGLYFDDAFAQWARSIGTTKVTCHPLIFQTFDSKAMEKYFLRLSRLQEEYGIHVMLENMPKDLTYSKLYNFPHTTVEQHLERITEVADEYGFLLTYDVSHAEISKPQNVKVFQDMLPKLGNIHMSSFLPKQHHLPLSEGEFDSKGFLEFLHKKKYGGLLTLEVYSPRVIMLTNTYNFGAIADSVNVFRKITDKLS
jgi:sugar phosphate isomerase/epimerase